MTRQTPRTTLDTLQAGRAFAALVVLLFHVEITLALPQYLGREIHPFFDMGYSGVHFFFVLSGFVIMLAHGRDVGRPETVSSFAWKRFRRIYPPLWIALLAVFPLVLLLPSVNHNAPLDVVDIVSAFALTPALHEPLLSVAWTLRHEMLFYAVFALIIWKPRIGLLVGGAWMALSAVLPWLGIDDWLRFFFTSQHLLFAFGIGAYIAFERGWVRLPLVTLLAGVGMFAATWAVPLLKLPLNGIIGNWTFGLGAALAIAGAAALERSRHLPTPRFLAFLGEASYAIYLAHLPVIYLACELIDETRTLRTLPAPVLFWAVSAVSLGVGVLFHLTVEKPLLKRLPNRSPLSPALP